MGEETFGISWTAVWLEWLILARDCGHRFWALGIWGFGIVETDLGNESGGPMGQRD